MVKKLKTRSSPNLYLTPYDFKCDFKELSLVPIEPAEIRVEYGDNAVEREIC